MKYMVFDYTLCIETAYHILIYGIINHSESAHQPPVAHLYLAKEHPQEHNQACLHVPQSQRHPIRSGNTKTEPASYDRMLQDDDNGTRAETDKAADLAVRKSSRYLE
ncbi:unnamed protein product [Brassica napus]|uniref:(rape) hypothetical protein n=1 Tax=Brassica napus TaxID=3708 RepID=A0A816W548_BRANA|nr:unnamed protein product [Brassica napus]